jgi:hypothetical protein
MRMLREMDLTDEQRSELRTRTRDLMKDHFEQTKDVREALTAARKDLREAIRDAAENGMTLSPEIAATLGGAVAQAESDLAVARSAHREVFENELANILGKDVEELRSELKAFREERIKQRQERWEQRKERMKKFREQTPPNQEREL